MSDGTQHDAALSSIRQRRTQQTPRAGVTHLLPALIGLDELQLAIPWRGGLHQSPEGVKKSKHFGSELFWAGYV
jgi:hypothetical protein